MQDRKRTCLHCGKEFTRAGQFAKIGKYCSNKCQRLFNYWKPDAREKQVERCRQWKKDNPEKYKLSKRNWHLSHKEQNARAHKDWQLKRDYGISLEEYEAECARLNNCCEICKQDPGKWKLRVDHCHTQGHKRGLLCDKCNRGLGLFQDCARRLIAAASYLDGHRPSIEIRPRATVAQVPVDAAASAKTREFPR